MISKCGQRWGDGRKELSQKRNIGVDLEKRKM